MTSYKVARRSFLRACGGSAALMLPLLRSMEARAQGASAPRRLLILHHCQGSPLDQWRPNASATTQTFTLPANSAPFAPLQSKMVLIDGLNLVTATTGQDTTGNHGGQNTAEGGMVALMTGVPTLGSTGQQDHCAGGPSIDQILLDRSPVLGGALSSSPTKTAFGSLQTAADVRSSRNEVAPRVMSYRPPLAKTDPALARQPLFSVTQPLSTFQQIFGGALPPGMDAASTLAREMSVLDFMRSDLKRLRALAPASQKDRLDAHASAIQQLEATIRQTVGGVPGACTTPAAPSSFSPTSTGTQTSTGVSTSISGVDYYVANDPTNHPHQALGQAYLALIKAAFLCDLVRVATFSWSSATSWVVFPGTFDGATLPGNPQSAPHYEPLSATDSGTTAWWTAIDRYYAQQSSLAIQAMAAATDLDGNSLLDNTLVVYVTEESRRWDHDMRNVPLAVFGGKNTGLAGGTFLKITDGPLPSLTGATTGNRPFNDFWLALAGSFGVPLTSLGAATQFTGALPGVFRSP